jgi:hypothetical protein
MQSVSPVLRAHEYAVNAISYWSASSACARVQQHNLAATDPQVL